MSKLNGNYRKTIDLLRKTKPELRSTSEIEQDVVRRILMSEAGNEPDSFNFFSLLFGWTEIVWLRRSLVTASFVLVAIFIYQQSVIVKQLNRLSTQIGENQEQQVSRSFSEYSGRLKFLNISGREVPLKNNSVSEEQLDMILKSLEKLQTDYEDLLKLLNENPELKDLVERKLDDIDSKKIKL